MPFNAPPPVAAPPVAAPPQDMTLAQASAAGTTGTAPPQPPIPGGSAPIGGPATARPVVDPHAGLVSVGTHVSQFPDRHANPVQR